MNGKSNLVTIPLRPMTISLVVLNMASTASIIPSGSINRISKKEGTENSTFTS